MNVLNLIRQYRETPEAALKVQKYLIMAINSVTVTSRANGKGKRTCSRNPFGNSSIAKERPELCSLVGVRDFTKKDIFENSPELNEFRYNDGNSLQPGWKNRLKAGICLLIYRMGWLQQNIGISISDEEMDKYLNWLVDNLPAEDWGKDQYMQPRGSECTSGGEGIDTPNGGTVVTPPEIQEKSVEVEVFNTSENKETETEPYQPSEEELKDLEEALNSNNNSLDLPF